jgi:hypothetical protein
MVGIGIGVGGMARAEMRREIEATFVLEKPVRGDLDVRRNNMNSGSSRKTGSQKICARILGI